MGWASSVPQPFAWALVLRDEESAPLFQLLALSTACREGHNVILLCELLIRGGAAVAHRSPENEDRLLFSYRSSDLIAT